MIQTNVKLCRDQQNANKWFGILSVASLTANLSYTGWFFLTRPSLNLLVLLVSNWFQKNVRVPVWPPVSWGQSCRNLDAQPLHDRGDFHNNVLQNHFNFCQTQDLQFQLGILKDSLVVYPHLHGRLLHLDIVVHLIDHQLLPNRTSVRDIYLSFSCLFQDN